MPKTRVERLKVNCKGIQIDTTFVSHSSKGQGVKYINESDLDSRTAISNAIAAIYGPSGLALSGGTRQEVEQKVMRCRQLAESYWNDALMSALDQPSSSYSSQFDSDSESEEDETF